MIDGIKILDWLYGHLELILTIFGFGFTIFELNRTKNSVEASKKATEETLQLLSDRFYAWVTISLLVR